MEVDTVEVTFWACEPDELEESPFWRLTEAVRNGDIEEVRRLLESGVGLVPQRPLPASLNPLVIEATCCGHRDVLEMVLAREPAALAAVDVVHGASPLHWAALRGDWGAAHLLLTKQADIICKSWEGLIPLHCAAMAGHRSLLELLLERGSPVDAPTNGRAATPLILAAEHGFTTCVEALLRQSANLNAADSQGVTPLLAAASGGHAGTAHVLLQRGADPTARDAPQRRTVLHWAAYHDLGDVAEEVLGVAGAEVDAEDAQQETPLLLAARRGAPAVVELLLQRGAGVDKAGRGGVTPLMSAAFFGHEPVVSALLGRGANVRAADATRGRTPLHWSAASDAAGTARLLLDAAADVAALDKAGLSPFDLAVECGADDVLALIRDMAAR